jgi:anti-sigma factor RsiW
MADGELPDGELARLRQHIGICPSCARRFALYEFVSLCAGGGEIDAPAELAEYVMDKVARLPSPRKDAPVLAAVPAPRAYRRPAKGPAPRRAQAMNARNMRRLLPVAVVVLLMFVLKARLPDIRARQERSSSPPASAPAPRPNVPSPSAYSDGSGEAGGEAPAMPPSAAADMADMDSNEAEYAELPGEMPEANMGAASEYNDARTASPAPAELYGAVTVTGDLPVLLLGRAMMETDYGVYALLATRDEADYLIALGYEASLTDAISQDAVAIILYAPDE